jgi:hypothetical protein
MIDNRFGERKFGTTKFGPSTLPGAQFALDVDWDADGLFDGSRERDLREFSVDRGRQYTIAPNGERFEEEDTGKFTAILYDLEGRYDFYNENSPLFEKLSGGKRFRIRGRTSAGEFDVMSGSLSDPNAFKDGRLPVAALTGEDGWGYLRDQAGSVTVPLQENIYADDAMRLILERADWRWDYQFDAGVDERRYYWVDQRSAARALHELAGSELGNVCVRANGALAFYARTHEHTDVLMLNHDDCISVRRATPKDVIRNLVRVQTAPLLERNTQVVWSLPGELEINPGQTLEVWAEYQYNNASAPVKSPVTPVGGTDYAAWTGPEGSGSNITGQVGVTLTSFSTRALLQVTNNSAGIAYVTLQVRGNPIAPLNSATFEYRNEESIRQFGLRPFTLVIDQNLNKARQYRDLLGNYLAATKNFLIVELIPNPEKQFGADLGDVIRGDFAAYHIDRPYRIIKIVHDHKGNLTRTSWWLEPYERLFSGVQLPFQLPAQLGANA